MFKFITDKEQLLLERRKRKYIEARQHNLEVASSITFVTLAENGSIDEVTAAEHINIFSPWVSGMTYTEGAIRQYDNDLYRCVQSHTSQDDWTPNVSASLWIKIGTRTEEFPMWSQPVGSHDAYSSGDKVIFADKKWISTADRNVWAPGTCGWEEI